MKMQKKRIGVFDSGIGGITILNHLADVYPNDDFIYIADTAYIPYGTKHPSDIHKRVVKLIDLLVGFQVDAVVIACNTATAHLYGYEAASFIPILGVIEPTATTAKKELHDRKILLLATDKTVASTAYDQYIDSKYLDKIGCSVFVDPIEQAASDCILMDVVSNHLQDVRKNAYDAVILGCTHFALIQKQINMLFPTAIVVDSIAPTANALVRLLPPTITPQERTITIYATSDAQAISGKIPWFSHSYQLELLEQ